VAFDRIAEAKIREAIESGAFDNLDGKGRKIDLRVYFATPEDRRVGYALLKSNGFAPEEVDLLKTVGDLRQRYAGATDAAERTRLGRELESATLKLNIALERAKWKRR